MSGNDLASLQWKWDDGFVNSTPAFGSPVYKQMPDPANPGPTNYQTVDKVDSGGGNRDGYLQGSDGSTQTLTLSGTNLANLGRGMASVSGSIYTIDNAGPRENKPTPGSWEVTVTSQGKDGQSVTTTKKGQFSDSDGFPHGTDIDADRKYFTDTGYTNCYVQVPDGGYTAEAEFPNYGTNSVTITFKVSGLKQETAPDGWTAPPTYPTLPDAKWGLDNVALGGSGDCGCSGGSGGPNNATGNLDPTIRGVSSNANGIPLSADVEWANTPQTVLNSTVNGNNTTSSVTPYLLKDGTNTVVAVNGAGVRWFDDATGSGKYVARRGVTDTIAYSSGFYTLTNSDGTQSVYYDFSSSTVSALQGRLSTVTSPSGDSVSTTTYTYDSANSYRLSTITRNSTDIAGQAVSEQFVYGYVTSGVNTGKIASVTLQRSTGGGGYLAWRQTNYRYYNGSVASPTNAASVAYGNSGDLMSVTTVDPTTTNQAVIDTSYLRYFTGSGSGTNGYVGGLEYVVRSQSYARLVAAGADPLAGAVSDATIATYADDAYQYDPVTKVVTRHVAIGEGATGQGVHTYSYGANNNTNTVNIGDGHGEAWASRTDETLPDGTVDRTYYNAHGQTLLGITIDSAGHQWGTYYMRDSADRVTAAFSPSTMTLPSQSTLEANPDLLNFQNGRSPYLNLTAGKVDFTDYYGSNSATISETTPGGAAGYMQDRGIGRGELSLPVSVTSVSHTSTTVLITTGASHGYSNGDSVTISGADVVAYNGSFVISNVSSTTFQYSLASDPGAGAAGANITAVEQKTLVSGQNYFAHAYTSVPDRVYPVATQTRYRNSDGTTGAQVTQFSYSWNYAQIQQQTVIAPPIVGTQNGPATNSADISNADTTITVNDVYGRPIWAQDGGGFISYTAYDAKTGAVVEAIVDVNTTNTADFSGLPSGWTSTNHAALHLVTKMQVDGDGRTTKITDPRGMLTFTTFNDINHEIRSYKGSMSGTNFVEVGPTSVSREDRAGSYTESLTFVTAPHLTAGVPDGTETVVSADIRTLARTHTTSGAQSDESDRYFTLGTGTNSATYAQGQGSFKLKTGATTNIASADFYATTFGYDTAGRQNRTVNAVSTITRNVYDSLGRLTSTWVGTNDTPVSGTWSPTNAAAMTKIQDNFYDTYDPTVLAVGDGNLTRTVSYPTGTNSLRVTENFYDWRDRVVATKSGVLLDSNNRYSDPNNETNTANIIHRPISYYTYDNLSEVTKTERFDGDGITLTGTNHAALLTAGVPSPISTTALRARTTVSFDDQGRAYRTDQYDINQYGTNAGTLSTTNTLSSQNFYDHRGNVMASSQAGGLVGKYVYDGAGRMTKQYMSEGGILANPATWNNYSNAASVTGDVVVQQMENTYDADGNVTLTTTRQRFHNDATNGAGLGILGDRTANPKARVSYQAFYYDAANRLTDSVDVGTNGTNGAYSRPGTAPTNSTAILLLNHTGYSDAGWADTSTDPRGIKSKTLFDMRGRATRTIANWDGTSPSSATSSGSVNQITDYTYDGEDHILTQKAWVNNTGTNSVFQTTQYVFGVNTGTSGAGSGSSINSNDILAKVQYPDTSSGNPGSGTNYSVVYSYNAVGQSTIMTDRTGTTHTYGYDPLGRKTSDIASVIGTGVNSAIRRIGFEYDTGGRLYQTTSYADVSGTNTKSQVRDQYNGLGQLTREDQSINGAIDAPFSTYGTIQYAYNEMAGGANNSRQTNITYPGMRQITYDYNPGLDNAISRTSASGEGSGTSHAVVEGYSYLGLGTIVERTRPQDSTKQSYAQQTGDTLYGSDGGDQYTGLDRFGRVTDQWWFKTAGGTVSATIDRFQYGYDQGGNVLFQKNLGPGTAAASFSELYHANSSVSGDNATAYDNLNRLTGFRRGTLSASANNGGVLDTVTTLNGNTNAAGSQSWNLDVQGNTATLTTNGTAQNRTTDQQNELKTLTTGTNVTTLTYDNNGSLTKDEQGRVLSYDAWGRLASVYNPTTRDQDIYTYDGMSRAAGDIRQITGVGQLDRVRFFSKNWQPIEERDFVFDSTSPLYTNVYGLGYVDDLVERNQYYDTLSGNAMNDRLWVQQDQNHNVTSIANDSAVVQERFVYDPYKKFTVLDANWANTTETKDWSSLGQGMRWEKEAALYEDRNRFYSPTLQRFVSQDPAGYVDGASLYQFVTNNPVALVDPFGLESHFTRVALDDADWNLKGYTHLDSGFVLVTTTCRDGKPHVGIVRDAYNLIVAIWTLDQVASHLENYKNLPPDEFLKDARAFAQPQVDKVYNYEMNTNVTPQMQSWDAKVASFKGRVANITANSQADLNDQIKKEFDRLITNQGMKVLGLRVKDWRRLGNPGPEPTQKDAEDDLRSKIKLTILPEDQPLPDELPYA